MQKSVMKSSPPIEPQLYKCFFGSMSAHIGALVVSALLLVYGTVAICGGVAYLIFDIQILGAFALVIAIVSIICGFTIMHGVRKRSDSAISWAMSLLVALIIVSLIGQLFQLAYHLDNYIGGIHEELRAITNRHNRNIKEHFRAYEEGGYHDPMDEWILVRGDEGVDNSRLWCAVIGGGGIAVIAVTIAIGVWFYSVILTTQRWAKCNYQQNHGSSSSRVAIETTPAPIKANVSPPVSEAFPLQLPNLTPIKPVIDKYQRIRTSGMKRSMCSLKDY